MARIDGRENDQPRPVEILPGINRFAEGSRLIRRGNTHVLCTASVEERTPPRPRRGGLGDGGVLHAPPGQPGAQLPGHLEGETLPRSAEIQRLVGRALRAAVDLKKLGARTITIDCDVLQGDGGTRTASVTGGFVALSYACWKLVEEGVIPEMPITTCVAAVSAGIVDEVPMLDLCYEEDSSAMVDLNCVMNHEGEIIELQGTGEGRAFTIAEQRQLVDLCQGHSGDPGHPESRVGRRGRMKVVLASHNQKKMVEMKAILSQMGVEVLPRPRWGGLGARRDGHHL